MHPDDTIAALASPPGAAARGIVRLSGRDVPVILENLFIPQREPGRAGPESPHDERADTARLFDENVARVYAGQVRMAGLYCPLPVDLHYWPRRSYTGEPLAEFHTVGSPPLLEALLAELFAHGVRPAQPGEFTLRAFLAGRLDLTQAEAVLGVIDAGDERELQTALAQLAGGISTEIGHVRGNLLDLLADLEAGLDFADEAIEFVPHAALVHRLSQSHEALAQLLDRADDRMRPATQPRVVLAGPPNAGKSTLFNALVERDAALVSEIRGTTRDYLSVDLTVSGLPITLIDTAGWELDTEGIAQAAQHRRSEQIDLADLILWCVPADACNESAIDTPPNKELLLVITKSDLVSKQPRGEGAICLSAQTGEGLSTLKSAIANRLAKPSHSERQFVGSTAARCRDSLRGALAALDRATGIAQAAADQELLSVELRDALDELGKIVGAVYTDDILDRVFSKFCIGK